MQFVKARKILEKAIRGSKDIHFDDMVILLKSLGFHLSRKRGSHHIFICLEVKELINIQNVKGKVKPYQIRQVLKIIERYNLKLGDE